MPAPARLHQVAVLALPGVLALDFGIPVHAFGTWDGGPYAVTVCTEVPGPVRLEGAPALLVEHGLEALADADTIVVPGRARPVAPSARVRAALVSGRGPRDPHGLDLHRGLRARCRGPARRPARHHPLAVRRRAGSRLPGGDGRPARALRRRRQRPDLGRRGGGNRPVPAHHPRPTPGPWPPTSARGRSSRRRTAPAARPSTSTARPLPGGPARSTSCARGRCATSTSRSPFTGWPARRACPVARSSGGSTTRPGCRRCTGCWTPASTGPENCSKPPTRPWRSWPGGPGWAPLQTCGPCSNATPASRPARTGAHSTARPAGAKDPAAP